MTDRPPFDMQRACFVLMAIILLVMTAESALGVFGCAWLSATGRVEPGTCVASGTLGQAREVMTEALTAVLALLLAARSPPPP